MNRRAYAPLKMN